MPITAGCSRREKRVASTFRNGQAAEREHREHRVDRQQDHRDGEHGDAVGDRERDHHDEGLDLLQVRVGPAHQLAGLGPVVEREVQALEVGEQPLAQIGLDPAGLAEREVAAQPGEDADDDRRARDGQRPARSAAMSSASIPRSTARCTSRPTLTLPAVQPRPTSTPSPMPARRCRHARGSGAQPGSSLPRRDATCDRAPSRDLDPRVKSGSRARSAPRKAGRERAPLRHRERGGVGGRGPGRNVVRAGVEVRPTRSTIASSSPQATMASTSASLPPSPRSSSPQPRRRRLLV